MNEIAEYFFELCCVFVDVQNFDVFDLWQNMKNLYSTLTQMTKNVLIIFVFNVEIERIFFMTRDIVHYRRSRLHALIIESVIILKKKYQIVEKFDDLIFDIFVCDSKNKEFSLKNTKWINDDDWQNVKKNAIIFLFIVMLNDSFRAISISIVSIDFCWYNCGILFSTEFNSMACDLRLNEHTTQMYISSNIASSGHVIHKNEHIKTV